MNRLIAAVLLTWLLCATCNASGDVERTTKIVGDTEVTVFTRGGKTILAVNVHGKGKRLSERTVRQTVLADGKRILDLIESDGKTSYIVPSKSPYEISIGLDATGKLDSVLLFNAAFEIVEAYRTEDTRLVPIPGDELQRASAQSKETDDILKLAREDPEVFLKRVKEFREKHAPEASQNKPDARDGL